MSRSARGLLFTILGELVLPSGGAVWTASAIDVLGRLGVEEKAARQALMRTAHAGWLRAERHGRRTRWHLTTDARELLTEGTRRIYGFTACMPDWDGRIALVLARPPASDRSARHRLRTQLGWAGFGSPTPGVWLSTHTDRIGEVERILDATGVAGAQAFVAEPAGTTDLAAMVRLAWDLDAVGAAYARFLAEFSDPRTSDPLPHLVELVHAWRRFPSVDPALPRALLPRPWIGERAATVFGARHAAWSERATAEWARLERPGRAMGEYRLTNDPAAWQGVGT